MASELNIDSLTIEIEATSNSAVKSIDKLTSSLTALKGSSNGFNGLKNISNSLKSFGNVNTSGIDKLVTSINRMRGIDKNVSSAINAVTRLNKATANLGNINSSGISSLVSSLAPLKSLEKTNLGSTLNQLNKLPSIANGLNSVSFSNLTKQIVGLTKSFEPLKLLEKTNLGSSLNQLKKLPETVSVLDKVDLTKFSTQISKISKALVPLANQTQKMSGVFSKLPFLVKSVGTQFDKYTNKMSKANASTNTFRNTVSKSIGSIRNFQFAMALVGGALGGLFEESSSYIENLNLFNVAMGDATQGAMNYAQKVQDAMGIDISEWLRFQGSFNMLITGFDVASDKAQIMSQNLTQLAYDYGSLMNVDVDVAFDKINSAMSGQIKGLKEFGNNVSVAMVKQTGLKYGLTGAVASWDNNTQAIMRYVTIMENASKVNVFNDMARTIATPANAVRILTQQFTQLKRALGNIASVFIAQLIPYAQMFIQVLTGIANAIASFFGFELPTIDYSGIAGGGGGLDELEDEADDATGAVGGTSNAVKELKKQLMGFDELNLLKTKPDDTGGSGGGGGSGGAGGGTGIGDIELPTYDFLDGLENNANETIDRIMKKLSDFFKPVTDSWDKYGSSVLYSMKFQFDEILKLIGTIGDSFNDVWQNGTGEKTISTILSIIENINMATGFLAMNFREAWDSAGIGTAIIQTLWDALNIVLGAVDEITYSFSQWSSNVDFKPLLNSALNLAESFKELVKVLSDGMVWAYKNVLEPLMTWTIEKVVPSLIDSLASAMKGLAGILKGFSPLLKILANLATALLKIVGNAILAGIKAVTKVVEKLGDILGKFKTITSGLAAPILAFIAAWKVNSLLQASSTLAGMTTGLGTLKTVMLSIKNLGFTTAISGWLQQIGGGTGVIASMTQTFLGWNTALATTTIAQGASSVATKLLTIDLTAYGVAGGIATTITTALGTALAFLAANPLVAIGLAIGAVVAAFSIFGSSSDETVKKSDEVSNALKRQAKQANETKKEIQDMQAATKDRVAGFEAESEAVKMNIDKLKTLSGEDGYVQNIEQAKALIEKINEHLPDTVKLTSDGKVEWQKTNEEIEKNIKLLQDKAVYDALYDDMVEALKNEKGLRSEMNNAVVTYNETLDNLNAKQAELNGLTQESWESDEAFAQRKLDMALEVANLASQLDNATTSVNATTDAYNVNGEAILDAQLAEQALSGTTADMALNFVAQATSMGQQGTSTWDSLTKGMNDTSIAIEEHTDKLTGELDEEGKAYAMANQVMATEMVNKAGVFGMTYEQMIAKAESDGRKLTDKEKATLKLQYDMWYLNSDEIAKAQQMGFDTLQFQSTIAMSDLNEDQKKSLAVAEQQFIKTGDTSGLEMLNNLAEAIKKNQYKSDENIDKTVKSAEEKCKKSNPTMEVKVSKPSKSTIDKMKTDIKNEAGEIRIPVKLVPSQNGIEVGGKKFTIKTYATGGFPDMGEMFIAREAGPELVGRINGKNAVANNDQIVGGIASGVYSAVVSAMSGSGKNQNVTVNATFMMDGTAIGKKVIEYHNGVVKQTGESPLLI